MIAPRAPGLALAAALFLAGEACLFQAALVYAGNAPLFRFGLVQLGLVLVPAFVLATAVLVGLASNGPARVRATLAAGLAGLAVAAWVGATFLAPAHGLVDGRSILQLGDGAARWTNGLAYGAVLLAAAAFARWRPRVARNLLLALFAVHAAQVAWIVARDDKPWAANVDRARFAQLSADRNVLVILLDALQSDVFQEAMASDPQLRAAFDGFTYFPNAVAHAPTTYLSLPSIHSGIPFMDGAGIRAAYRERVVEGSFMAQLAAHGWDAVLVNPILQACPRGAECYQPEELMFGEKTTLVEYAVLLVDLAAFRMAPVVARPWIYREGRWISPTRMWLRGADTGNRTLDRFATELHGGAARPAVRFLHLFATHPPATIAADCTVQPPSAWTRPAAVAQDRCALQAVARVLAALRAKGLYDNTAIVVLADHGAGLPLRDGRVFTLASVASALLVAKPAHARGPLAVVDDVVGLMDVAATVCGQARDCRAAGGRDAFGHAAPRRAYPFLDYQWDSSAFGADAVAVNNLFALEGPPGDVESWQRMTNVPTSPVQHISFGNDDPVTVLGLGWSGVEIDGGDEGRRALDPEVDVYMRLPQAREATLRIDVSARPGAPAHDMRVLVDGRDLGTIRVDPGRRAHELPIPPEALHAGVMRVVFKSVDAGPEPRVAAFFHELSVVTR